MEILVIFRLVTEMTVNPKSSVRRGRAIAAAAAAVALTATAAVATAAVADQNDEEQVAQAPVATSDATLCGASLNFQDHPDWQAALDAADDTYGGLESVRLFYQPGNLPTWPGQVDTGDRPAMISFKAHPQEIIDNADGVLDHMQQWFADAPSDKDIYWTYFHEPEDEIENGDFGAEEYREAWEVLAATAEEVGGENLHATLILMEWTLRDGSGRDWTDYYAGDDVVDVMGWDPYNFDETAYPDVEEFFSEILKVRDETGLPFGVAEIGSPVINGDDGSERAEWIREVTDHLTEEGALFAQWFDLDWTEYGHHDWRLSDEPSQQAWHDFCQS